MTVKGRVSVCRVEDLLEAAHEVAMSGRFSSSAQALLCQETHQSG